MDDDPTILLILGLGALVVVLIVVFGVMSSRRKARATAPRWQVRTIEVLGQPALETTSVERTDDRQWQLFQERFGPGTVIPEVSVEGRDGPRSWRDLTVSRVRRSLRSGWPQARVGFTAYFEAFENREFPANFRIDSPTVAGIACDRHGVTVTAPDGTSLLTAAWDRLLVSNGPDVILQSGDQRVSVDAVRTAAAPTEVEEVLIKYGQFRQLHF